MKALRVVFCGVLIAICSVAFGQTNGQKSFDEMKALTGAWQGSVTLPPDAGHEMAGKTVQVTLRTTSSGNAILHEMKSEGAKDDPITMLYLDGDRLLLTHYCDAGNRPRMVAKSSADGKTVEFEFLDLAGSNDHGHMAHAVFTFIDADHHTEDWTYMMPGDKPMKAHFELERVK